MVIPRLAGLVLFPLTVIIGVPDSILQIRDMVQSSVYMLEDPKLPDSEAFKDIDTLKYNLQSRMSETLRALPSSPTHSIPKIERSCVELGMRKVSEDMFTLSEYFSISNQEKTKLFIKDTYPGQKRVFLKEGLNALSRDIDQIVRCYTP